MRWFVEISSLGKGAAAPSTVCVEAAQWQPALQKARAMRGDDGALSNFSIELLDDGYRAIDPATRLRYIVRKAPDDAPLSNGAAAEAKASVPPVSSKPAPVSSKPAPVSSKPEPPAPVSSKPEPKPAPAEPSFAAKRGRTVAFSSEGAAMVREAVAQADAAQAAPPKAVEPKPVEPKAVAPKAVESKAVASAKTPSKREIVDESTTVAPAAQIAAAIFEPEPTVAGPLAELLFERSEDPSDRSPLTYREYGYFVQPGTPEDACVALLRERFEEVHEALRGATAGRLVNLAIFDHRFEGKPERRPLVTLTWKDWRGDEPELRFPAREAVSARPAPPPPPVEEEAHEDEVDVELEHEPSAPPPARAPSTPPPAKAPSTPPAKARSTPPPAAAKGRSTPPPAVAKGRSTPPPAVAKGGRLSGDDLLAELFEAFCDLHFLRDSLEGADFILSLVAEKLPCEVCLVSLFDIDKREFVVVRQNGGRANVILTRQPDRAPIPLAAMRGHRAVVVRDAASDPRVLDPRWKALGVELKSYLCAPVELSGRYLGLIELANPGDGGRFNEGDGNALTYIGQQFGEFVGQRGVLVDAESVAPALAPKGSERTSAAPPARASATPPRSQKQQPGARRR
jgi:hypothetical protein